MKTYLPTLVLFVFLTAGISTSEAVAEGKSRKFSEIKGSVASLTRGQDRKQRKFLEYQVTKSDGSRVLIRDYRFNKFRQPASAGLIEGGKTKAKGFFVNIRTVPGSDQRSSVLIVPAN